MQEDTHELIEKPITVTNQPTFVWLSSGHYSPYTKERHVLVTLTALEIRTTA